MPLSCVAAALRGGPRMVSAGVLCRRGDLLLVEGGGRASRGVGAVRGFAFWGAGDVSTTTPPSTTRSEDGVGVGRNEAVWGRAPARRSRKQQAACRRRATKHRRGAAPTNECSFFLARCCCVVDSCRAPVRCSHTTTKPDVRPCVTSTCGYLRSPPPLPPPPWRMRTRERAVSVLLRPESSGPAGGWRARQLTNGMNGRRAQHYCSTHLRRNFPKMAPTHGDSPREPRKTKSRGATSSAHEPPPLPLGTRSLPSWRARPSQEEETRCLRSSWLRRRVKGQAFA